MKCTKDINSRKNLRKVRMICISHTEKSFVECYRTEGFPTLPHRVHRRVDVLVPEVEITV